MAEYQLVYRALRQRLLRTQQRELLLKLLHAEAWAVAGALLALVLVATTEALLFASSSVRMFLWYGWLILTAGLVLAAAVPSLLRLLGIAAREPLEQLALRLGRYYPQLGDMLCNVLQLVGTLDRQQGVSRELALAAFVHVARQAENLDFDVLLDRRRVRRAVLLLLAVLGLSGALLGAVDPLRAALQRLVEWHRSFVPPPPFTLRIEPQDVALPRGTPVTITVRAEGIPPAEVFLHLIPEGGQQSVRELHADTPGLFLAELGQLSSSLRFYARAHWMGQEVSSPVGSIRMLEPLLLRSLRGKVEPPAYTHLAPFTFDDRSSELVAPLGSLLWLTVEANKPLRAARVVFVPDRGVEIEGESEQQQTDTLITELRVTGATASGSFRVESSGSWTVELVDHDGQRNPFPVQYRLVAQEDASPQIMLLEPTEDVELSESGILPLRVFISDDYGFSRLLLFYRLVASQYAPVHREFRSIPIPFLPRLLSQEVPYVWDLTAVKISPGDRYEFFVEVWDNDAVTGPKSARTRQLTVQLPTLEQVLQRSEVAQERAVQELQEAARQLEELRRRSEQLQRQLSAPPARQQEAQWEQQRQLQVLVEHHQELQERLGQVQREIEETLQRLEQFQAISPETVQKYRELQQLLREIQSPQLQQLLERMQQALQQMSPEQLRQALQNFRFNEQEFRAALERTLRLLKRLQAEQKLDALRRQLERMAEEQEALHRETERAQTPEQYEQLAQRQRELQQQWERLQGEWQQLERLLREVMPEAPQEALQRASQQMDNPRTGEALRQAGQHLQQRSFHQAQQFQRQAASQMRSAAGALQQLWEELQRNLTREVQRQLQKAVLDALELSEQQEQLWNTTRNALPGLQRLSDVARQQEQLRRAVATLTERVMTVAQKSFVVTPQMARELGIALRSMQQAREQLSEREPVSAAQAQQQAMEALNRATLLLQDALSALQAAGSGACPNPGMGQGAGAAGFLERLQQLALQQQGITAALQQLFQGRLTPEQQAQLARLAAQQGQVQRALEELSHQQRTLGGERLLGDLRRIAEEMREVVEELQSGKLTAETLRRQHRILTRMLDAMRSLYERDYEPQRESRPGQNVVRPSPPALRLPQGQPPPVPPDFLQLLRQKYSPDYQQLIERYFELLHEALRPGTR
ncbi:hypothetical protein HRbin21_01280 [bacterium HR21]|nr:hypothetical protein HRbin21_01280 [bacterium HR21]